MTEATAARARERDARRLPGDTYPRPYSWQLEAPADSRWGTVALNYSWDQCRYCGTAGPDCPRAVCLACATPQCGFSRGCLVCIAGFVGRPPFQRETCGYKGCERPAVAEAPRVGRVCLADLGRPKSRGQALSADIANYLRLRDHGGLSWQHLTWFGPPLRYAVRRWTATKSGWTTGEKAGGFETAGQADREARAWEKAGWHAERVTLTPELTAEIKAWQAAADFRLGRK